MENIMLKKIHQTYFKAIAQPLNDDNTHILSLGIQHTIYC